MVELRRFTQTDWYGTACASPWDNGDQPWIGHLEDASDHYWEVVVDAAGVNLMCFKDADMAAVWALDEDRQHVAVMMAQLATNAILEAAQVCPGEDSAVLRDKLQALGFTKS